MLMLLTVVRHQDICWKDSTQAQSLPLVPLGVGKAETGRRHASTGVLMLAKAMRAKRAQHLDLILCSPRHV